MSYKFPRPLVLPKKKCWYGSYVWYDMSGCQIGRKTRLQITSRLKGSVSVCTRFIVFLLLLLPVQDSAGAGGRKMFSRKTKFRPSIPQFCWNSFVVVVTYVHALSSSSQKILLIIFFGSECIVFPVGEERKSGDGEIRCFLLSSSEISQSSMLLSLFPFLRILKTT